MRIAFRSSRLLAAGNARMHEICAALGVVVDLPPVTSASLSRASVPPSMG